MPVQGPCEPVRDAFEGIAGVGMVRNEITFHNAGLVVMAEVPVRAWR